MPARSVRATAVIGARALKGAAPRLAEIVAPGSPELVAVLRKAGKRAAAVAADAAAAPLAAVASWYAYAASSDPDALPYDLSFWRAEASVVGNALGAWLATRRSAKAVPVLAGTAAVTAGLGLLQVQQSGAYVTRTWPEDGARERIFNRALAPTQALLAIVGIANAALAHSSSLPVQARHLIPAGVRTAWTQVRRLGLYYMVFSFLGHWGEMLFCTGIKYGLIPGGYDRENHMLWDQWLFPFPAEGIAAVLAAAFLHPLRLAVHDGVRGLTEHRALALPFAVAATFLVNQAVCTSIDYATGMVANQNYELWDYRDMPLNFQGQICLQNSLIYSAIATWAVWRLIPNIDELLALTPETVLDGTFVGLGSFFGFVELLYHVLPKDVAALVEQLREVVK